MTKNATIIKCGRIVAAAITFVLWPLEGASANDWDDCFQSESNATIIEGCDGIIASDHLQNWQRAMALNNRADALGRSGHLDAAEDSYTRALALDPYYAKAYYNRGTLRQKLGNLQGALIDFDHAIRVDPNSFEAYHNRSFVYEKLGEYDHAITDSTKALSIKPDLYFALNIRGVAYRKKGMLRRAIEDFDAAIAINAQYAKAYNNRAKTHLDLKDHLSRAVEDAGKAIELNPGFADAYYTRGRALEHLARYREAIEDYARAAELDETHVGAREGQKRLESSH